MSQQPTPPMSDLVFALGMKAGAATTLEVIRMYGFDPAAEVTYQDVMASLSEREHAILADALRQIRELRTAPNDPAPLTGPLAPTVDACPNPSCGICHHRNGEVTA